jgi:hypothetical protein
MQPLLLWNGQDDDRGETSVPASPGRALADNDLARTYARLPNVRFSRDTLAHQARRLLVLRDSGSGWTNVGSPDRAFGLLSQKVKQPAWLGQIPNVSPQVRTSREVEK